MLTAVLTLTAVLILTAVLTPPTARCQALARLHGRYWGGPTQLGGPHESGLSAAGKTVGYTGRWVARLASYNLRSAHVITPRTTPDCSSVRQFKTCFITPLYQQRASHTLAFAGLWTPATHAELNDATMQRW